MKFSMHIFNFLAGIYSFDFLYSIFRQISGEMVYFDCQSFFFPSPKSGGDVPPCFAVVYAPLTVVIKSFFHCDLSNLKCLLLCKKDYLSHIFYILRVKDLAIMDSDFLC